MKPNTSEVDTTFSEVAVEATQHIVVFEKSFCKAGSISS